MEHRCELRFRYHRAFTYASLSRVPLCVSWAFLFYINIYGFIAIESNLELNEMLQ